MIAICKLQLDNKGRITFPKSFLTANNLTKTSTIAVYPIYNKEDAVRLEFNQENK